MIQAKAGGRERQHQRPLTGVPTPEIKESPRPRGRHGDEEREEALETRLVRRQTTGLRWTVCWNERLGMRLNPTPAAWVEGWWLLSEIQFRSRNRSGICWKVQ